MVALAKLDPDLRVMVRADESIAYAEVVKVLKVLYEAKITRMSLVTQGEARGR